MLRLYQHWQEFFWTRFDGDALELRARDENIARAEIGHLKRTKHDVQRFGIKDVLLFSLAQHLHDPSAIAWRWREGLAQALEQRLGIYFVLI